MTISLAKWDAVSESWESAGDFESMEDVGFACCNLGSGWYGASEDPDSGHYEHTLRVPFALGQTIDVMGHQYTIREGLDEWFLAPVDGAGSCASAKVQVDSYNYTHGGPVYQAAVRLAKLIDQCR